MMREIGIIGGGNMGEAILAAIRKSYCVSVCEASRKRQKYLQKTYRIKIQDLATLAKSCSVLILAVKPQSMSEVLNELKTLIKKNTLVISIAAGITTQYIEKKLTGKVRVVRTMPNLPAQIQMGMTALCKGKKAMSTDLKIAAGIFNKIGATLVVKEIQMDAVTAISGSGPGYVYFFMEQMIAAAMSLGLSKKVAKEFVIKTIGGSVCLALVKGEDAASLLEKVTSKGGTTQAALDVFKKKKFASIMREATKAAAQRAKKLSRS
ncbi:MAG: pyrroline-5-carboxylate reductase [Candidatus Aceula meridiana]|nr:pyrroline-5-carboxylate reductase [Candidatus Aceula meridiana]